MGVGIWDYSFVLLEEEMTISKFEKVKGGKDAGETFKDINHRP